MFYMLIAFADFAYQKIKFANDMKMTKQEIKEEYKQQEGDPQIKGKIRQKMRETSMRRMMQSLPQADVVINSSNYSTARLRGELLRLFGDSREAGEMIVSLVSFGFKHGLPMEADLVFDVRFMPNPFYIDSMRHKTGLDQEVRDYVLSFRETEQFLEKLRDLLRFVLPLYREEGKTMLVVAVGCTGGHHRSVAVTHALAGFIASLGYQVTENHRDMTRN